MYRHIAPTFGVPFVALPPQVNLSDPAYARRYARASFTNVQGDTFRGGVIYPTIAPVEGAKNPAAAQEVLNYLFSSDGKRLLDSLGFLPNPLLLGGDRSAVPEEELRPYFEGTFPPVNKPRRKCHHHRRHHPCIVSQPWTQSVCPPLTNGLVRAEAAAHVAPGWWAWSCWRLSAARRWRSRRLVIGAEHGPPRGLGTRRRCWRAARSSSPAVVGALCCD